MNNRAVRGQRARILENDPYVDGNEPLWFTSKGRAYFALCEGSEIMPLLEFERRYILAVLKATNWQIKGGKGAAGLLGVPVSTLYGKMRKLGIKSS